jgi:ribose transport system substrate-binding protein
MNRTKSTRLPLLAATGAVLTLLLAACGGSTAEETESADPSTAATSAAAAEPSGAASAAAPSVEGKVAFLNASSANTWLQASKAAMEEVGAGTGVELVEFDAQFTPGTQAKQIQDIIAAGDYKGIIISAIDGAAIIPDLQAAIDAGLQVVILNQVVGERLDTADPQFEGPAASVLVPPLQSGKLFGELTVQACEGIDPCNVVYFYGIKGTPIDTALKQGFDETIADQPNIAVVAEAEGQYLGPDVALAAMQDVIQKQEDISVVVGSDQAMQGAELALTDAGLLDKVKIIGLGGSEAALAALSDGRWFGDVYGAPFTEGQLAMQAMLAALADGTVTGGVDPLQEFPNGGLITAENVGDYTAQWAG